MSTSLSGENHFDFDFGQQIDFVFAAAVGFGVAFLAAVAADFEDGHALRCRFRCRASFTDSKRDGWMIASIFVIASSLPFE